jgi:hypothetical protein
MQERRKLGRPSHATVVAYLALFVALCGSAYAVKQLPKKSVGTKQLKGGAVTKQKVRKNAINGSKVKNNSLTGADINLSKLGTVPSANTANSATTATSATTAANAVTAANFSRYHTSGLRKASPGQTAALLTVGPFTIIGKCVDKGGGELEAQSFITTAQPGSSLYGYVPSYYEGDFNPGIEAELSDEAQGSNTYVEWSANYGQYTEFRAASADGQTILEGESVNAVFYAESPCAFWVSATNLA